MTTTLIPQHMEALRKSHDAFCCASPMDRMHQRAKQTNKQIVRSGGW